MEACADRSPAATFEKDLAAPAALHPWRQAVRRASAAVGVLELPSTRLIELSPAARDLIGAGHTIGLEVISAHERSGAAAVTRAATSGAIDGTEVRRRRWRRRDGSVVEVTVRSRAIRLESGATFGLFVARDLSGSRPDPIGPLGLPTGGPADSDVSGVVILDDQWRVQRLSGDLHSLGAVFGAGAEISQVVDPDDIGRLLFAFAGATTQVDTATRLRLLTGGSGLVTDLEVARLRRGSWRLTLRVVRETASALGSRSAWEMASDLRRLAGELQSAGQAIDSAAGRDVLSVAAVRALPDRQREIVVRLARGERVGSIASHMYLSASTVRNHLSAVFRRFGVHSQQELLSVLLLGEDPPDGVEKRSGA